MKVTAVLSVGLCTVCHMLAPVAANQVHVFISGGQSECKGWGSWQRMVDEGDPAYTEYLGNQPNAFVASMPWNSGNGFAIRKLNPQHDQERTDPSTGAPEPHHFGPELGFGNQYVKLTNQPVVIIKSCQGGTSAWRDWNSGTEANSWDRSADDGTSEFLKPYVDVDNNQKQYINMIYTIRKTVETLGSLGYAYKFMGILWNQGQADKNRPYWEFGEDTKRVFDGIREEGAGIIDLPIIDSGADSPTPVYELLNHGQSGKRYAYDFANGCNVVANNFLPSEKNAYGAEYFGWDYRFPNSIIAEFDNPSQVARRWVFKNFPGDMHSDYPFQIMKGKSLANRYIMEWGSANVPEAELADDAAFNYPLVDCDGPGDYDCIDDIRNAQDKRECIVHNPNNLPYWDEF